MAPTELGILARGQIWLDAQVQMKQSITKVKIYVLLIIYQTRNKTIRYKLFVHFEKYLSSVCLSNL